MQIGDQIERLVISLIAMQMKGNYNDNYALRVA